MHALRKQDLLANLTSNKAAIVDTQIFNLKLSNEITRKWRHPRHTKANNAKQGGPKAWKLLHSISY